MWSLKKSYYFSVRWLKKHYFDTDVLHYYKSYFVFFCPKSSTAITTNIHLIICSTICTKIPVTNINSRNSCNIVASALWSKALERGVHISGWSDQIAPNSDKHFLFGALLFPYKFFVPLSGVSLPLTVHNYCFGNNNKQIRLCCHLQKRFHKTFPPHWRPGFCKNMLQLVVPWGQVVCDLIEERSPPGVMAVLDDTSLTMNAVRRIQVTPTKRPKTNRPKLYEESCGFS